MWHDMVDTTPFDNSRFFLPPNCWKSNWVPAQMRYDFLNYEAWDMDGYLAPFSADWNMVFWNMQTTCSGQTTGVVSKIQELLGRVYHKIAAVLGPFMMRSYLSWTSKCTQTTASTFHGSLFSSSKDPRKQIVPSTLSGACLSIFVCFFCMLVRNWFWITFQGLLRDASATGDWQHAASLLEAESEVSQRLKPCMAKVLNGFKWII